MGILLNFPKRPLEPASGLGFGPTESTAEEEERVSAPEAPAAKPADPVKKHRLGARFWMKATQAVLLSVAVCFSLGASNSSGRLQSLDHRLMCTCGCAQLLGECNHVGCTESTQELSELRADIAAGQSDQQIFNAFVVKYGATVLAAPPTHGFDLVAWIAPFAVFAAALLGTILLIRRWGGLRGFQSLPAGSADPAALDPAERERRKKIRRETDVDGGDGGIQS